MKFFKVAILLLALTFVTSHSFGRQTAQKDTTHVDSAGVADIVVFDKPEANLVDSLQVAKETTDNKEIKEVIDQAQEAIANMPAKDDGIKEWLVWILGILAIAASGISYLIGLFKEKPKPKNK